MKVAGILTLPCQAKATCGQGNKLLCDISEYAAYQSTFQPIIFSGKPINVTGYVIYNFVP